MERLTLTGHCGLAITTMTNKPFTQCFLAVVNMMERKGIHHINALPGCAEVKVDKNWTVAVNGHGSERTAEPAGCMSASVPPFECVVWYNGWYAGSFSPYEGFMAAGKGANEDAFIRACELSK